MPVQRGPVRLRAIPFCSREQGGMQGNKNAEAMPSVKPKASHAKKPPLTHFLSLPIGHHLALRENWTQISTALLESSPEIPGLHESIILKPGGLHLTLGVLSLASRKKRPSDIANGTAPEKRITVLEDYSRVVDPSNSTSGSVEPDSGPPTLRQHTIEEALLLLRTLKDPIQNMLKASAINGDVKLEVPLERMDVMRSRPNQKLEQSHVLWTGPDVDGDMGKRLKYVCDLVHSTFKNAGMLQDDRPLKLHCTLINTIYRKEEGAAKQKARRRNKKRVPFSFASLISSRAYERIVTPADTTSRVEGGPRKIDLGSWTVTEVQLCEMGNKNADGVYRSVGAIALYEV